MGLPDDSDAAQMDWDATVGKADDVRRAFEALPMMVVVTEGPDHRIIAANAAFRAFVPKLAVGKTTMADFPEMAIQNIKELSVIE
jgi:PAS domain-containing protein